MSKELAVTFHISRRNAKCKGQRGSLNEGEKNLRMSQYEVGANRVKTPIEARRGDFFWPDFQLYNSG